MKLDYFDNFLDTIKEKEIILDDIHWFDVQDCFKNWFSNIKPLGSDKEYFQRGQFGRIRPPFPICGLFSRKTILSNHAHDEVVSPGTLSIVVSQSNGFICLTFFDKCKHFAMWRSYWDENGELIGDGKLEFVLDEDLDSFDESYLDNVKICMVTNKALVLYSLSMINAKNIDKIQCQADERVIKKRKRRSIRGIDTWSTIKIGGPKYLSSSRESGHSESTRMHFCRGHFKTYTSENPLMGKHVGSYWWNYHVRGNEQNGKVHAEYMVKA